MGSTTTTTEDKSKAAAFRIGLGDITPNNLGQLKRLNTVLFPVVYTSSFYKEVLEVGEFAKIIYFNDICVGGVCCRKENVPGSTSLQNLYIATLGVLAPYRRLGLGSKLLKHILENAKLPSSSGPKIAKVYLHVQTNNEEAVEFYKKYGFEVVEKCENYYPQFDVKDAFKLEKVLIEKN
ncbi:acyl-CoA N-acyltransferase [Lobosporangium transversale]|uniref:Acyl-CoA N-acyltransferase n=1 Tax=Lobosporangium transversale TaxID=64571 RepID=A0A1Y2GBC3_9FUNG|nr:acyl-CoA N-acyltransferase [Lobosporangium transversale]ORZ04418.1 acyl-CoA N-acyltransferase [Lobosporangium transversale]|eukprot:XP_021876526.1 acyl-CoA N-acyltransferase [Lobosporangium transversale]